MSTLFFSLHRLFLSAKALFIISFFYFFVSSAKAPFIISLFYFFEYQSTFRYCLFYAFVNSVFYHSTFEISFYFFIQPPFIFMCLPYYYPECCLLPRMFVPVCCLICLPTLVMFASYVCTFLPAFLCSSLWKINVV